MVILLALGFSSGLPIMLVYSSLSVWMLEVGISLKTIGIASTVLAPYKLKLFWAPLVDRIKIPIFGLRRGWLVLSQLMVIGAIVGLGLSDPTVDFGACIMWAAILGTASATHDIVVDGYRVELLSPEDQGAGCAVAVLGYRIGMIVSGGGALLLAQELGTLSGFATGIEDYSSPYGWNATYLLMVPFLLPSLFASLFAPEPPGSDARLGRQQGESLAPYLWRSFVEGAIVPYVEMVKRPGSLLFIAFIMLFTLGESLLSTMTMPFMIEIGFSKNEIGTVVKIGGPIATILGAIVGGALVKNVGVIRALWLAGLGQMFLNLLFSALALIGDNMWALVVVIVIEKFSVGIASIAFVAYLSALCSRASAAAHYSALMSASGVVKVGLAAFTGHAIEYLKALAAALPTSAFGDADQVGWALYFAATTVAAGPGMILLYFLNRWNMTGLTGDASGAKASTTT